MAGNSIKFSTLKPFSINLSDPPRSNKFITNINASTLPLEISINLEAASAVPPVAIKSSIINTVSFSFIESLCTSIVAVPYSSSKSIEWVSLAICFFF